MTRPHRTLALASLLTILLTLLGANAASAEDRTPARPTSAAAQAPVVSDHGSDARGQDNRASSLATCYGGRMRWDAGYIDEPAGYENFIPGPDDPRDGDYYYVTSANCRDINMRLVHYLDPTTVRVCFIWPISLCDPAVTVQGSGWHVIAWDVPDGWEYYVYFPGFPARRIGDIAD